MREAPHGLYGFEDLCLLADLFYDIEFQYSFPIPSYGGEAAGRCVWRYADWYFRRGLESTCGPGTPLWAPLIVFFLEYDVIEESEAYGLGSTNYHPHGDAVRNNRKT